MKNNQEIVLSKINALLVFNSVKLIERNLKEGPKLILYRGYIFKRKMPHVTFSIRNTVLSVSFIYWPRFKIKAKITESINLNDQAFKNWLEKKMGEAKNHLFYDNKTKSFFN